MRLAIIADIHGNIHALEAVLADIHKQSVDQIIANGDFVNRAPNNVAVLELLNEQKCTLLLGNHDDLVCKWAEKHTSLPQEWFEDPFWASTAWVSEKLLESGWLEPLKNLPIQHTIKLNGKTNLRIAHGSPRHYREGYGRLLTNENIEEITEAYPASVYVGSHTHRPMHRHWKDYLFLNTGAVGTPFNSDPRAQYLLMTLERNKWQANFRAVEYDQEAALRSYETTGFLQVGGLSAHIFYKELYFAKAIYSKFWTWSEDQEKPKDWQTWQLFMNTYPEIFTDPKRPVDFRGKLLEVDHL